MSVKKVFGKDAEKLKDKTVLIIGTGGLGCTVASLLARMKIRLIIVEDDFVSNDNLERQLLYDKQDILKFKVDVAKNKLSQFTKIKSIKKRLSKENISKIIPKDIDLVIDCTDNVETRLLINDYCKKNEINWIYSAAIKNIGAIYFINNTDDGPCYQCFNQEKSGESSCDAGILNTLVVMVASMTTNIAIDYLISEKIEKQFIRINLRNNDLTKINVKKNPKCQACKGKFLYY